MSSIYQRLPAAIDHIIFLFHTWMRMVKATAATCAKESFEVEG